MAFNGGDIEEISYNHPEVGQGVLYSKSGEESTFDRGGYRTNDDEDSVATSGEPIYILTRKRWSLEVQVPWDMNDRDELDKLSRMAASTLEAEWTARHSSGAVYRGTGKPVGDLKGNGGTAMIPVKISGGGQLEKI